MYRPWMQKRGLPLAGGPLSYPAGIAIPSLPAGKERHRAFYIGGRVYVVGGNTLATYSWAPGQTTWTTEANKPAGIQESWNSSSGLAVAIGTKILCIGGTAGIGVNTTAIFDTVTKTWSSSAAYGFTLFRSSLALASGGRVAAPFGTNADPQVIIGINRTTGNVDVNIGKDFATSGLGTYPTLGDGSDVYHVAGNSAGFKLVGGVLSALGALTAYSMDSTPYARLSDGAFLLCGGINGINPVANCGTYKPGTGWTVKASMGTNRSQAGAATLADGRAIVVGGYTAGVNDTATCEIYDPNTNTWTATGSLRTKRAAPCIVNVGGYVVSIGGQSSEAGGNTQCDVFNPATGTWDTSFPNPDA